MNSPAQLAIAAVVLVAVVGFVLVLVRNRGLFAGYEEITGPIKALKSAMKGEVSRDGTDVVVDGMYGVYPAQVHFSNSEHSPALHFRVQAPATFTLNVTPSGVTAGATGRQVSTGDAQFDARFTSRSDQPLEAKLLFNSRTVAALRRLCVSSRTFLRISPGALEFSEMVLPPTDLAAHLLAQLTQLKVIADTIAALPGAEVAKIKKPKRERYLATRLAIAAGAIVAIVALVSAIGVSGKQQSRASVANAPTNGIVPVDALLIREPKPWHVAEESDFDSDTLAWLKSYGVPADGRVEADLTGSGSAKDVAYFLLNEQGVGRIAVLSGGINRFDAQFSGLSGIARIPKESVPDIQWKGAKPEGLEGDGIAIIRAGENGPAAQIIFLRGNNVLFGTPADFQNIELK